MTAHLPQRIAFPKAWANYSVQVALLSQRGLVVQDAASAERFLSHLNYYRFSGYCLAFESQRHQFVANTTFEQIVEAYEFDLELRDLLTEALEVVEVDFRTAVAYFFGQTHGPFGHIQPQTFHVQMKHTDWLERLRKEARRSSELFVSHFRQTYSEFPDLPIWMATEVMSFGALSQMVDLMRKKDQTSIAHRYGLQPHVLISWMHHLVYVRNICAHHSRVWDRIWAIKPLLPAGKDWKPPVLPSNAKLCATLLILSALMRKMPSISSFAVSWRSRVENHLSSLPSAPNACDLLDLTGAWSSHREWR